MTKNRSRKKLAVTIFLVVLTIITALSFDPILKVITKCTRTVVIGTSMLPTLKEGDLVFIKEVDSSNINIGDIIVFEKRVYNLGDTNLISIEPTPWIHRVVKTEQYDNNLYFKTQGDNVLREDFGWIPEQAVIGKLVLSIPFLGHLSINPAIRTLNILVIILLIFTIFYLELKNPVDKKIINKSIEEREKNDCD